MGKKARQTVSYVLEGANASGGHKLGVQSLAVDRDNSILYSGGRDGIICAWDLNIPLKSKPSVADPDPAPATTHRTQTHAHLNWVNSVVLTCGGEALASASTDFSVKLWRPHSTEQPDPVTLGQHTDYAKCIVAPPEGAPGAGSWVATGGFDRKIRLWDLAGHGSLLEIDTRGEDVPEKGSVYALATGRSGILAAGGPEKIVRLWDSRAGGAAVAKFVGHTDMIRALLVDETGDMVVSGSSDQTIKIWSVRSGRCVSTLGIHSTSVWALHAEDPAGRLDVIYSADRDGLMAKTDIRGHSRRGSGGGGGSGSGGGGGGGATAAAADAYRAGGRSIAVGKEENGVWNMVACGGHIWPATAQSSINRWADVDMTAAGRTAAGRTATSPNPRRSSSDILAKALLAPASYAAARAATPVHRGPEHTIEGHFGLLKSQVLNNRRHVLTSDTAGEVVMWDVVTCKHIKSFGRSHIEDVRCAVDGQDLVPSWCAVDTSSGSLVVTLDQAICFDAEVYADELGLDETTEYREDQRVNLGKWVLRYLFANLIDEEIRRDEAYRQQLNDEAETRAAEPEPEPEPADADADATATTRLRSRPSLPAIQIPMITRPVPPTEEREPAGSLETPRAGESHYTPVTPGMTIKMATPATATATVPMSLTLPLLPPPPQFSPLSMAEMGVGTSAPASPRPSSPSPLRPSSEQQHQNQQPQQHQRDDYFTGAAGAAATATATGTPATTPARQPSAADLQSPAAESDGRPGTDNGNGGEPKEPKTPSTPFGKKFRNPFVTKKRSVSAATERSAGSTTAAAAATSTALDDRIAEDESETASSSINNEREIRDSFAAVIRRIRTEYQRQASEHPDRPVETRVTPSLPTDTPVLKLPTGVKVIIQEETTGGMASVYQGTVGSVGAPAETDTVERRGPAWLAELLLQNLLPNKDPVKITFVLLPYPESGIPAIAGPGGAAAETSKLNANRLLRVKKILAYIAERLEPAAAARPRSRSRSAGGRGPSRGRGAAPARETGRDDDQEEKAGEGEEKSWKTEEQEGKGTRQETEAGPAAEADENEEKGLKPEEYLELHCNDQLLSPNMTLATLKAHVWKGPGELVLYYRSNGRREFATKGPVRPAREDRGAGSGSGAAPTGSRRGSVAPGSRRGSAAPATASTTTTT